jgi:hypothetical protein
VGKGVEAESPARSKDLEKWIQQLPSRRGCESWAMTFRGHNIDGRRSDGMGLCMTPVFDPAVPEAEYDGDGKGLARFAVDLDELAEANGLTPLTAFLGYFEDVPQGIDDSGEAEDQFPVIGMDEWYASNDGLRTATGLIQALESDPGVAPRLSDSSYPPDSILEELKELERCLGIAASQGVRFRMMPW